ncbi:hypothetical protein AB1M95_02120 [Sulfitobacter sp. LCG007]
MPEATLTAFLGRTPTDEERAIHADQTARLGAVRSSPLLAPTDGLRRQHPFPAEMP